MTARATRLEPLSADLPEGPPSKPRPAVGPRDEARVVDAFLEALARPAAWDEEARAGWCRAGRALMRLLAARLRLEPGSYEVRMIRSGPAVAPDVTLHHERLYVLAAQRGPDDPLGLLYRPCRGRRDHVGGGNRWLPWSELADLDLACAALAAAMEDGAPPGAGKGRGWTSGS